MSAFFEAECSAAILSNILRKMSVNSSMKIRDGAAYASIVILFRLIMGDLTCVYALAPSYITKNKGECAAGAAS